MIVGVYLRKTLAVGSVGFETHSRYSIVDRFIYDLRQISGVSTGDGNAVDPRACELLNCSTLFFRAFVFRSLSVGFYLDIVFLSQFLCRKASAGIRGSERRIVRHLTGHAKINFF
jgi:hypothetical protein